MMLAAVQALAQPAAVVEGVQMPAWVERAGVRAPITPGMLLQPGDILHTGSDSRLLVRLSERSLVKLGENGSLRFTQISATREILRAALGVLKGAFRFATDVAIKSRQREVSVAIGTITTGIRGTDFWGRSRPETDLQVVYLIEGAVAVEAPGEAPVVLDQPLQFYRRLGGQVQPIGLVEPPLLQRWADETDIQPGRSAARRGGRFHAELARVDNQSAALQIYDAARGAGTPRKSAR
jgi:hypothetical protein